MVRSIPSQASSSIELTYLSSGLATIYYCITVQIIRWSTVTWVVGYY
jgi:hypothetical protein